VIVAVFRRLGNRLARTALTVAGIAIGVLALVVVRRSAGVRGVVPEVVVPYATGFAESSRFGPPSLIFGFPYRTRTLASAAFVVERGRKRCWDSSNASIASGVRPS